MHLRVGGVRLGFFGEGACLRHALRFPPLPPGAQSTRPAPDPAGAGLPGSLADRFTAEASHTGGDEAVPRLFPPGRAGELAISPGPASQGA
jgi:hypothetical protein